MIRFPCPRCPAALKVADERAGQKITCPKCQQSVLVPEPPDEEEADEPDTHSGRKVPVWVWATIVVVPLVLIAVVIGVVVALSGPRDGMTRAERAELEVKMKRDLPGAWEQDETNSRSVYTFTDDGRFEVARYKIGKKVGGHVGRWSVSGSRVTLQVTESADDDVQTGKPFEMTVTDVKSEGGKVFKFTLSRTDEYDHRTLARQRPDELATDEGKAKCLVGTWEQREAEGFSATYRFEASGQYTSSFKDRKRGDGWASGMWWIERGRLVISIRKASDANISVDTKLTFELKGMSLDRFILAPENEFKSAVQLTRKK